jgi:ABC-type sugar transport system permease subunit
VAVLRWLYRWPLFIPFVVAGQVMRTFLAKNGMLNHVLIGAGLIEPARLHKASSTGAGSSSRSCGSRRRS